jgi:hypothetical protein
VSVQDQCEHEVIGALCGNDNSLTAALRMCIVFSVQLEVQSRPTLNV